MEVQQKEKTLDLAISQIEKQFGQGSIMRMGEDSIVKIESISTGSISLDAALGIGGIPRGRITEIYGPESSGKTTLTLHIIAEAQKMGGYAAFIDAEHAMDPEYAKKLGVDTDNLLISQPDTGEQALDITETLVRSGALDIIVIDSVAALVPKAELDGDMGDSHMGLQARLMSQALRKLTGSVSKSRTSVIFINQIRHKIGVMFGSPETTTGGNALKFYASIRLDIRRIGQIKEGDQVVGNRTRVKVVKNKVAPPFKNTEFDIMYGEGISYEGDLLDLAVQADIVNKMGAWYSYNKEKIGQGRENAKRYLQDNENVRNEIETGVKDLALKIFELVCKYQQKEKIVRIRGKYIPMRPYEWKDRVNVTVQVGLGTGSKEQQLILMNAILERQMQAINLQQNVFGPMVNLRNIYNSLKKLVENAGFNGIEPYFMDPDVGAAQMPQLPPKPPTEFEKVTLAQVQGENQRAQLNANVTLKEIEGRMRQQLLDFEIKIKELELKYGSKIDELELKRRSMLEQADLNKSGDLMKEIVKGQQQFFNDGQKGNSDQGGKESPGSPKRSPTETGI